MPNEIKIEAGDAEMVAEAIRQDEDLARALLTTEPSRIVRGAAKSVREAAKEAVADNGRLLHLQLAELDALETGQDERFHALSELRSDLNTLRRLLGEG